MLRSAGVARVIVVEEKVDVVVAVAALVGYACTGSFEKEILECVKEESLGVKMRVSVINSNASSESYVGKGADIEIDIEIEIGVNMDRQHSHGCVEKKGVS